MEVLATGRGGRDSRTGKPGRVLLTETPARGRSGPESIRQNVLFAFAMRVVSALFTAGLTLFLVRYLGPHDYGVYALALSVGGVVLLPADLGVTRSAARFIAERRGDTGRGRRGDPTWHPAESHRLRCGGGGAGRRGRTDRGRLRHRILEDRPRGSSPWRRWCRVSRSSS